MNLPSVKLISLSDAQSLTGLFAFLSVTVISSILQSNFYSKVIEHCHWIWLLVDSLICYLIYITLNTQTICIISWCYSSFTLKTDQDKTEPWRSELFQRSLYLTFKPDEITLYSVDLFSKLKQAEENFIMKKNNCMQKAMTEKINKFCFYWQSQDSEGDDSFTEWKLFTPDSDVIQLIWKHIHQGKFTSAGFAEELYKSFFPRRVWLADNAVSILIKADIINSVCNTY